MAHYSRALANNVCGRTFYGAAGAGADMPGLLYSAVQLPSLVACAQRRTVRAAANAVALCCMLRFLTPYARVTTGAG